MKLKGKTAIITGAGKGIGRAIAELFLKEGANVVLASRTKKDLDCFEKDHLRHKKNVLSVACDVSEEASATEVVRRTTKKFGRVDVLVNNAGFGVFNNFVDSRTKDFDEMFNTNVRGLYLMTRESLRNMIPQNSGTIINISSVAGKIGVASGSIYCATKHAVMGLSKSLFLEVRQNNIRVVAICPGNVDTAFFRPGSNTSLLGSKDTVLQIQDIAESCLLAASLPMNATITELEIRPTNPRS